MPNTNTFSNSINLTIGNTDFQIIFSPDDLTKRSISGSPEHYHLFCECHFVKFGELLLTTPHEIFTLHENTFIIIPPNVKHAVKVLRESSERMVLYLVVSKNSQNAEDTFSIYEPIFFSERPHIHEHAVTMFDPILQYAQFELGSDFLIEMKLKNLLELIFIRIFEQNMSFTPIRQKEEAVDSKEKLRHVIADFILDNFLLYAHLEDLSDRLHLSPRQTDRVLKQLFHKNFQEIKTSKRVETAKILMTNPANSLKAISEMVGYGSYTGFYETFKNYTGMSPEEYRQKSESNITPCIPVP